MCTHYIIHKIQKIGNKGYAYEITSYYDRLKKRPAQKTRYLGQVVDKEKGEFARPGRVRSEKEKLILDFGVSYFLIKFMEKKMKNVYDLYCFSHLWTKHEKNYDPTPAVSPPLRSFIFLSLLNIPAFSILDSLILRSSSGSPL